MQYLSMFKACMIRGGTGADPGTGVRPDIGVVTLRCRNGTCGGARIGVDQTLAWCGEWCGPPIPVYRSWAIFIGYADQFFLNIKT